MTQTLAEHHRGIAAGLAEVQRCCGQARPDLSGLATARLRLNRASSARSIYLRDVLIPNLRATSDPILLAKIGEMERGLDARRLVSSGHVTAWSSAAIAADWDGYRRAARRIWAMMEEQMVQERQLFG